MAHASRLLFLLAVPLAAQPDELASKSQRARQAMVAGRFDEAGNLYADLIRAVPNNAGLLANLGMALHSAGRHHEALAPLAAAAKLDPALPSALIFLGIAYLKLDEPAKAIDPLSRALRLDAGNRIVLLELADAQLAAGRPAEAAVHFGRLTELDPAHPKAWQGLGLAHLALSRRAFEALEREAPGSGYWYMLLAQSKAEQGEYRTAFALYRKALEVAPAAAGVHTALAGIYRRTGHDDWAAVEQAKEPRGVASDRPPAAYLDARRHTAQAFEAFARLSRLPSTAEIHELMALALRIQRRHKEAALEFSRALEGEPANPRLAAELARSLWLNRDYEAALPLLERAGLRFELGDALLELQQVERAIPHLEAAVAQRPKQLEPHASLARAYIRAGRPREALEHLRIALPLDEDGSLHFQLARARQRLGHAAEAEKAMAQYKILAARDQARKQALDQERQITAP